jgi:lipid-A-disaccharide synthase-like uncharacterized protein
MTTDSLWLTLGLAGQACFVARFLVQWLASERVKRSVVPRAFWHFSVGGGLALLTYAIHRQEPVFAIGQAAGLLVYLRNLSFGHKPDLEV